MTNYDYKKLEARLYKIVSFINGAVDIHDWDFNIYYSRKYNGVLLLSRLDKYGSYNYINATYDIQKKIISGCKIAITDEMHQLGNIHANCSKSKKIESEEISDVDIKI